MFAPVKLFGRKDDLKSAQRFSALCAFKQGERTAFFSVVRV
jgi:hypothetical protein